LKNQKKTLSKSVETIKHDAKRKNIPTAELESLMRKDEKKPVQLAYERRNRDLDPQLVWRGKDDQDESDLIVQAPPLYIQEKVHPKALIDDLKRQTEKQEKEEAQSEPIDLFSDFNGLSSLEAKTEFYQHDSNWSNRMILGDSLQVMASLAEREHLRGQVQCVYFDPPYGIKFNSNFQWSTTSRDVKDGNKDHITREPEQVKAFRDTWRDGIHSYLTYLRDRLTVARDLLADSGSIFVQIGDENVHRVRVLMGEVFGEDNFVSQITVAKTSGFGDTKTLSSIGDYLLWYAKKKENCKYRQIYQDKDPSSVFAKEYKYKECPDGYFRYPLSKNELSGQEKLSKGWKQFRPSATTSQGSTEIGGFKFDFCQKSYEVPQGQHWKTSFKGLVNLAYANRLIPRDKSISYIRYLNDFPVVPINNIWLDLRWGFDASLKRYVVETNPRIIARCLLMTTDPGDLILDPTCGSGTTAYVAEQWGRRWITIDTSRVSLALARARIMGARYPFYTLADSKDGQFKEAELKQKAPSTAPTYNNIRHGFVYERVPHITLKSIANNAEIDVIWEKFQQELEPIRKKLNTALKKNWEEWEIPRETDDKWPAQIKNLHKEWWNLRIARQKEIDASIAAKAEHEYLYDKPYEDNKKVRVAGPFTVESLSPHRILAVDENDEIIDQVRSRKHSYLQNFAAMILENLRTAGVQQAHKQDKITFTSLTPWPGNGLVCAEGRYMEGDEKTGVERRAGIFIGPEFGTVAREDLVAAARECGDAEFDVLIACAFSYEAHTTEFEKLGRVRVLKARMNADLHMAETLKNTGKGNLFVIFGEPDIDILPSDNEQIKVKINGVDVFRPNTGEIISDNADGIACWFVDTDYNEESFFIRHAYFLGAKANDPYKSLKTTLKSEINQEAWDTLYSDASRPFDKPKSGRIAVKVINHLGDEVMKVYKVN
jgi:adenine-specific DNA-methyltransferase